MSARIVFDILAILACAAMAGLVSAKQRHRLGAATAVGIVASLAGGTLRDILLNRLPVFWIKEPWQFGLAWLASGLAYFALRRVAVTENILLVPDALAVAVPAAIAAQVTRQAGHSLALVGVLAMIAGILGGVLRDLMSARAPAIFKRELYAVAAFAGGIAYGAAAWLRVPPVPALLTGILTAGGLRIVAVRWKVSCD